MQAFLLWPHFLRQNSMHNFYDIWFYQVNHSVKLINIKSLEDPLQIQCFRCFDSTLASGFPSLIWFNLSYTVFCICDNSWTSVEQLRKNSCRLNICLHGSSDCGGNAAWSPEMLAGLHYSQWFCLWFVILTKQNDHVIHLLSHAVLLYYI